VESEVSEWPALQDPVTERLILRDGSVAAVRQTVIADHLSLCRFFRQLSSESRYNRFFTVSDPSLEVVARFCDSTQPTRGFTLVALRERDRAEGPIAAASYFATDPRTAEVAFAVADGMHGNGLGTALLERLAVLAHSHGFERFEATTRADNREMLEVFRDSGFEMHSQTAEGVVQVRLDLAPSARSSTLINERNRLATVASLQAILAPHSVAVIGVSRDPSNMGRRVYDAIRRYGFVGSVYAVNPNAAEIDGQRCYSTIREVPAPIDLVVIATPRTQVLQVLDDCGETGVKAAVILTAGFAELGQEGKALQQQVLAKARANGMRLVGPNCMGVLNTDRSVRLNASFAEQLPPEGRVSIASQSGGVALALLQLAASRGMGISSFVSLGNKADVSGNDLLQWGESDPGTSVLLLYLESFGNPRRFAQLARRITRKKPIVVVKAGRTSSGNRAAGSHTAGLASNETAVAALFEQSGVIRADTIGELFDIAQCLDLQVLPRGNRVGIITNAGGPGILAADACEAAGLKVPTLSSETQADLAKGLSANATTTNPIDLVASAGPEAYEHAILTALQCPDIDSLIVMYTPIQNAQTDSILEGIGRAVAKARRGADSRKPVLACTITATVPAAPLPAGDERIPAYMFPENAARALGRAVSYAAWRAEPPALFRTFDDVRIHDAKALCQDIANARGDAWLTSEELAKLLKAVGLSMLPCGYVHREDDAVRMASELGFPVALKLDSPDVLHKTDVGAVRLDLRNEQDVREAFRSVSRRFPRVLEPGDQSRVLVQPMLHGVEMLVGMTDDPVFGPLVAFGLGGVETEVLRDVAFRLAPLTERDADRLMRSIRSFRLLEGYRGSPPTDMEAIKDVLLRVSLLAQHVPELRELDLNPLMVLPSGQGYRIVDARARVSSATVS
jgi:acetyl coenzyme A synthetase (ADP forming)-like protein